MIEARGNYQGKKISILFDSGATDSFISSNLVKQCGIHVSKAELAWQVELALGTKVESGFIAENCKVQFKVFTTTVSLRVIPLGSYDIILGMDWLDQHQVVIDCREKTVRCIDDNRTSKIIAGVKRPMSVRTIFAKQL